MLPVQKMATSYITKRIKDELLGPADGGQPEGQGQPPRQQKTAAPARAADPHDGQPVHDENGRVIGRAWRVAEVAVYVVTRDGEHAPQELARGLREEGTQTVFHTTADDHVTSIFYVPEPKTGVPTVGRGFRPDDV